MSSPRVGNMRIEFFIIFAIILGWSQFVHGAMIFQEKPENSIKARTALYIFGEIKDDDFEKMIDVIKGRGKIPTKVFISSPGGDVQTAMKIGRFLRMALINVSYVGTECNSSCFLILAAGPRRFTGKSIGIHRPYYDREYFSNLSPTDAEKKYKELDAEVREYLLEMDVPGTFIDRMMSIKSTSVEYINVDEFKKEVGHISPALEEWKIAKCGDMPESEHNDSVLVSRIETMEALIKMLSEVTDEQRKKSLRHFISEMKPDVEYAKTLSLGYRNYLLEKSKKIGTCIASAVELHQKDIFADL